MANGLSTQTAVSGLAQGLSLGMALENNKAQMRRQEKADERIERLDKRQETLEKREDETYAYEKAERERLALLRDMRLDLAAINGGVMPLDERFMEKYAPLGVDRLGDPQWRQQRIQTGQSLISAMDEYEQTGELGQGTMTAISGLIQPELDKRAKQDGLQRKPVGVRRLQDGSMAIELSVIGPDGKPYRAPYTQSGTTTADRKAGKADDQMVILTPEKLEEWGAVGLHQANAAYLVEQAGDDPRQLADTLGRIFLGQQFSGTPEYQFKKGYDRNGREQLFRIDGQGNYSPIGGSKAPGAVGLARSGGGGGDKLLQDALEQYQKDVLDYPDEAPQAFYQRTGFPIELIQAARDKRRRDGDYTPITVDYLNRLMADISSGDSAGSGGSGGGLGDADGAQPPPMAQGGTAGGKPQMGQGPIARPTEFDTAWEQLQSRLEQATSREEMDAIGREMAELAASMGQEGQSPADDAIDYGFD